MISVHKKSVSSKKSKNRDTWNFEIYIQDSIDISARYEGPVFYEYHKAFAYKVAAIKLQNVNHGTIVDRSIRDEKLITSGQIIKEYEICHSLGQHTFVCQTLLSVKFWYI